MSKRTVHRYGGFTLVELLIVMAIIGLLAAMVAPRLLSILEEKKREATYAQLRQLQSALDMFRLDFGRAPTTAEGLMVLWAKPEQPELAAKWRKEGYLPRKAQDGWKRDFDYKAPGPDGKPYDVLSYGADGQPGGEGMNVDMSLWD